MATIYPSAKGPMMHIHSALGQGRQALLGCIRERAGIYLTIEAVLIEFAGLRADRVWDEKSELFLLSLDKRMAAQDPGGLGVRKRAAKEGSEILRM